MTNPRGLLRTVRTPYGHDAAFATGGPDQGSMLLESRKDNGVIERRMKIVRAETWITSVRMEIDDRGRSPVQERAAPSP